MELVEDETAAQWNWCKMGLQHNRIDTGWDCSTMKLVKDGTATERTGIGLDCNTRELVQDGTATEWNW